MDWSPEGTPTPRRVRLQEGTPPGSDDLPTSPPIPMSPPPSYRQVMAAEEPDLGYGPRRCWRWEWRLCVVLTASPLNCLVYAGVVVVEQEQQNLLARPRPSSAVQGAVQAEIADGRSDG